MAGPAQSWNAAAYGRDCRFVTDLGGPVLDLLAPKKGERILDLGCGDGALTRKIAELGCDIVGVDADPDMVRAAAKLGLDVRCMPGEALTFAGEFDAVFSNAALHWMRDPEPVAMGVARALKPGGRFAGEFGGAGNVEIIRDELIAALERRGIDGALCDPWYFPTEGEYAALLEEAGFTVEVATRFERPTPVPAGLRAWLDAFSGSFTAALPEAERSAYLDEVAETLAGDIVQDGQAVVPYVRLRFRAVLSP
jgi:trans-aconitate methyltransferase